MCVLAFVAEVRHFKVDSATSKILVRSQRVMVKCLRQLFIASKNM